MSHDPLHPIPAPGSVSWVPRYRELPPRLLDAPTAWDGVESVIAPLMDDFGVNHRAALEFGVQHAYSTVALANYFDTVIGVDTFLGDPCAGEHPDNYDQTLESVQAWPNICLIRSSWQDWVQEFPHDHWSLIHVDIFHTYPETYECGKWAIVHAPTILFHDTISFPEVARAVRDLAAESGRTFYNLQERHGLGILSAGVPSE